MFYHLITIDNFYSDLIKNHTPNIPTGRKLWHYSWAYIFYLFDIDSSQIFLRAKIIHVIQTIISLTSIYYFSNVIIRNVFKDIPSVQLRWLSLWSVLIWLTIFATFSTAYHHVWMIWYSVNYQITLPLFWYMLGLTLVLLLEKTSWKIKLFFILQIILLTRFILQVHSMEFLYYLMHMSIFGLVFADKVYLFLKRYFYLIIPLILVTIYMFKHYQPEKSKLFKYLSWEKLPELYAYIMKAGAYLINGYNRAFASINELMYFILYFAIVFLTYLFWKRYKGEKLKIEWRVLLFTILTSLFVLIPLYQFSGGVFSVITKMVVVNRLYYSASIFVLIPLFYYALFQNYKPGHIHLFIAFTLISVTLFSKYYNGLNHNYYKNILSIKDSFNERRVGFNLSQEQINTIGKMIVNYEQNKHTNKKIKFYARTDIAFVIKYIYHKNVYWESRRANPHYKNIYKLDNKASKYKHILFNTPKEFPNYIPYQ